MTTAKKTKVVILKGSVQLKSGEDCVTGKQTLDASIADKLVESGAAELPEKESNKD